jgi:hypothetical protein
MALALKADTSAKGQSGKYSFRPLQQGYIAEHFLHSWHVAGQTSDFKLLV